MVVESVFLDGGPKSPTGLKGLFASTLVLAIMAVTAGCETGVEGRIDRVHALGRKPSEPNRNRIAAMAEDPDRDVRANALLVLNSIDSARARGLARPALNDPDGVVRGAAIEVLANDVSTDPDLAHVLEAMAAQDAVWQVRRRALRAIEGVDDPGIGAAFGAALSDSVRHVRRAALEAGAARPGLLPLERLVDLAANDPDWENRVAAAQALAASGDASALPALVAAQSDPNEFVRAEAARGRRVLEKSAVAAPVAPATPAAPAAPPRDEKPRSGV